MSLIQGSGWRWGWNGERGLIGGEDWAMELSPEEWWDWCRRCDQIWSTWQTLQAHLMPGENLTLEQHSPLLTLILTGSSEQMTLYVQLHTGRVAEGQWQGAAVYSLLASVLQGAQGAFAESPSAALGEGPE